MSTDVTARPVLEVTSAPLGPRDPLAWSVSGATPGERLVVCAEVRVNGTQWRSDATFLADASGRISPDERAPVDGTYEGIEPYGLSWSMRPTDGGSYLDMPGRTIDPIVTELSVRRDGVEIDRRQVRRELYDASKIERREVRADGLVGTFFAHSEPRPAIVVLGGSEGGLTESFAAALSSAGFATLALAYFGVKGLPKQLVEIPLEYFGRAIAWLETQPEVVRTKMGVIGASKGAELALLLGSTYPQIRSVVSIVGSGVAFMGIGRSPFAFRRSSWSSSGRPVPFVPARWTRRTLREFFSTQPVHLRVFYEEALRNSRAVEQATMPVERTNGPVLLVSGVDDQLWPSAILSDIAFQRLRNTRRSFPDEHLPFEGCGHAFSLPFMPALAEIPDAMFGRTAVLGGNPPAIAGAAVRVVERVVDFLGASLGA